MKTKPKIHVFGFGFKPFRPDEITLLKKLSHIILFKGAFKGLSSKEMYQDILRDISEKIRVVENKTEFFKELEKVLYEMGEGEVGVLATGDPLVFGIAVELKKSFSEAELDIHPDLSSLQVLCAKLGIPFTEVKVLSFHGRPKVRTVLLGEVRDNRYLAIFTDYRNTPNQILETLLEANLKEVKIYVGECLGTLEEKLHQGSPEVMIERTYKYPNLVLIENPNWGERAILGRRVEEFEHRANLITKDEVRGIVLHKLAPPIRGVIWDIGAGSGSISVELASLSKDLQVYAVEKNLELVQVIEKNKERFAVPNLEILHGEAPLALKELPKPDRIFIGGSGGKLLDILKYVYEKACPKILVATFVIFNHLQLAVKYLEDKSELELIQVQVNRARALSRDLYFKAENPIFILKATF